jgi:hypothetical protein
MQIERHLFMRSIRMMALASFTVILFIQLAWADGGINYKVKVRDECGVGDWNITVKYGVGGNQTKSKTLSDKGSVTFETGARCPYSIDAHHSAGIYAIPYRRCADGNNDTSGCSVSCFGSDWKLVKWTGHQGITSDGKLMCELKKD